MIVATRGAGNRELRFGELSAMIPPPGAVSMPQAAWGTPAALSIPAVACAVRLVAETIASFVMRVYEGDATARQTRLDAVQAELFQDPQEGLTSFDLWSDTATGVEIEGNAFTWKVMLGREVVELFPLPPEYMRVCRKKPGGPKVIEAWLDGETVDVTRNVIHTRGWSPIASAAGVSTIGLHGQSLRGAIALEEYRGRYFQSDATPNIILSHPSNLTAEQRAEFRAGWNARHAGPYGDRVGILWGGLTVQQMDGTLEDAQLAEISEADVRNVARMFGIFPASLLAAVLDGNLPPIENLADAFWRFSLMRRVRRIERSFSSDRDLFPNPKVYARFDPSEWLRGDIATTVSKIHQLRQVGMITPNEGRAELGYPPSDDPGADELLETPVGAGANSGLPAGTQLQLPLNGNGAHPELEPADSTA